MKNNNEDLRWAAMHDFLLTSHRGFLDLYFNLDASEENFNQRFPEEATHYQDEGPVQ